MKKNCAAIACLLATAILILALASCSGKSQQPVSADNPGPEIQSALPSLSDVMRLPAATSIQRLREADTFIQDPDLYQNVTIAGPSLVEFAADDSSGPGGLNGLAYCIYRPFLPLYTSTPRLRYEWETAPDWDNAWLAVGDFDRDAWEWHRMDASGSHDLGAMDAYLSGNDQMLIAVLLSGQQTVSLSWLAIGDDISRTQTLDGPDDVGYSSSMALIDGLPAIVYQDSTNAALKYVRARWEDGLSWNDPVTIPGTGPPGLRPQLVDIGGAPGVAYYETALDELRFIRGNDAAGTDWNASFILDTDGNVGMEPSLAVINGNPAIAYHEYIIAHGNLKYIRAATATGEFWGSSITVDTTEDVGRFPSMAEVDGRPAISYYDVEGRVLKFVRAADANGDSWGTPLFVDSNTSSGSNSSLAVIDGRPAISYIYFDLGESRQDLRYKIAIDTEGSSWPGAPYTVEIGGDAGNGNSMAQIGSIPVIVHFEADSNLLKVVRGANSAGTLWEAPQVLDTVSGSDAWPFLLNLNGFPAISYFSGSTLEDLKFILVAP